MVIKTGKQAVPPRPEKLNGGSLIRDEKLRQLYAAMHRCRILEARACMLARQQQMDPACAAAVGHEAAGVGCTIDLKKEDVVISARYALIGSLLHGIPLDSPLLRLYQPSVEVSIELASRLKKTRNVVVAFSAAGGFSGGMWHETLSAAGAESLPIIFVRHNKLAGKTGKAQSGGAQDYGFPRIPVDGRDVVAVYRVAHESIQRARRGGGPTLMECEPYIPDAHGPDTHVRNRVARPGEWRTEKDPIRHMELYLTHKGLFRESWKNRLVEEFSRKLDAAIDAAEQE